MKRKGFRGIRFFVCVLELRGIHRYVSGHRFLIILVVRYEVIKTLPPIFNPQACFRRRVNGDPGMRKEAQSRMPIQMSLNFYLLIASTRPVSTTTQ